MPYSQRFIVYVTRRSQLQVQSRLFLFHLTLILPWHWWTLTFRCLIFRLWVYSELFYQLQKTNQLCKIKSVVFFPLINLFWTTLLTVSQLQLHQYTTQLLLCEGHKFLSMELQLAVFSTSNSGKLHVVHGSVHVS